MTKGNNLTAEGNNLTADGVRTSVIVDINSYIKSREGDNSGWTSRQAENLAWASIITGSFAFLFAVAFKGRGMFRNQQRTKLKVEAAVKVRDELSCLGESKKDLCNKENIEKIFNRLQMAQNGIACDTKETHRTAKQAVRGGGSRTVFQSQLQQTIERCMDRVGQLGADKAKPATTNEVSDPHAGVQQASKVEDKVIKPIGADNAKPAAATAPSGRKGGEVTTAMVVYNPSASQATVVKQGCQAV